MTFVRVMIFVRVMTRRALSDGRMSMAGLRPVDIPYVASSIKSVVTGN